MGRMVETLHRLHQSRLRRKSGGLDQPIPGPHFNQSFVAAGPPQQPMMGPAVVDGMVIEPVPETAAEPVSAAATSTGEPQEQQARNAASAEQPKSEPVGSTARTATEPADGSVAAANIDVSTKTARADKPTQPSHAHIHMSKNSTSTLNSPSCLQIDLGVGPTGPNVRTSQIDPFVLAYRQLKRVSHLAAQRLLALTSLRLGPESSHVAIQMAKAAAEGGQRRVLLVDLAVQHRPLAELLGIPQKPDLIDVLDGAAKHADAIRWVAAQHFWLLGLRSSQRTLKQAMHSRRMSTLMAELRDGFELTLVHGLDLRNPRAPVWIASRCDLALLILPLGKVTRRLAQRAIDRLTNAGATVGGCILTRL